MSQILIEIFITLMPILLAASFLFFTKNTEKKFTIFFLYNFINILYFALYLNSRMDFLKISIFSLFNVVLIIYIFSFCNRNELLIKTEEGANKFTNIVIIITLFLFYVLSSIFISMKTKFSGLINLNILNIFKTKIISYEKISKKSVFFMINSNYLIIIYIIYIITANIFNDKYNKLANNREENEK